MIKNIFSVLIFTFIFSFLFFVVSSYFSENLKIKVKNNRETLSHSLEKKIIALPFLVNDSNNIIEFNTDFENDNTLKKRNFWKLFKKND